MSMRTLFRAALVSRRSRPRLSGVQQSGLRRAWVNARLRRRCAHRVDYSSDLSQPARSRSPAWPAAVVSTVRGSSRGVGRQEPFEHGNPRLESPPFDITQSGLLRLILELLELGDEPTLRRAGALAASGAAESRGSARAHRPGDLTFAFRVVAPPSWPLLGGTGVVAPHEVAPFAFH